VRDTLEKKLASFLRKKRGDMTLPNFPKNLDSPPRRFIVWNNASRVLRLAAFSKSWLV
jgi:hypothetical protein